MEKACIVLVTGAGGDAQGWGNMQVTESVRDAIIANGYTLTLQDVSLELPRFIDPTIVPALLTA